jgi:hypothetical protein
VCAFVRGTAISSTTFWLHSAPTGELQRVTFNPFRCGSFTLADGTPIDSAEAVVFTTTGAYAINPHRSTDA